MSSLRFGLLLLLLGTAPAIAQVAPDSRPDESPPRSPVPAPAPPPLSNLGKRLQDDGVVLRATVFDDFGAVTAGGEQRGRTNVISETFGADLDMSRLFGIPGGRLHATFNQENGPSISANLINTGIVLQSRYKPYTNMRLAILTYEQVLANGKVDIEGGRTTPLMYFNVSALYCQFQSNALCATPLAAPLYDGSLSPYPYSTWGGRVKVRTSEHTAVQVGAFEVNPSLIPSNGFVWSTARSTGTMFPVEFAYGTELRERQYPDHFRLGAFHDTSNIKDPFFDTLGSHGGTPRVRPQRNGYYVMGDQVIYRPDASSAANVVIFGGYSQVTDQISKYRSQATLGLVATGLVPGRPVDTIGMSAAQFTLGDSERALLNFERASVGGTAGPIHPKETLYEVNYGFQLTRGIRLLPALQYLVHPDSTVRPAVREQPRNAFVVGLRMTIDLHDLAHLPMQLAGATP
ncbi:MAG TPA: carbohydrate porin [Luteibacter sp.]|nr:carbohydrate porin [Luteibacter sp.]